MYVMLCTRLDIAQVIDVVSRFLSNPGKDHGQAMKWILIYLRGTSRVCLCFVCGYHVLDGYTNAYMASDIDFKTFIFAYMHDFCRGSCVFVVKVEYIVATETSKELLWMNKFLYKNSG